MVLPKMCSFHSGSWLQRRNDHKFLRFSTIHATKDVVPTPGQRSALSLPVEGVRIILMLSPSFGLVGSSRCDDRRCEASPLRRDRSRRSCCFYHRREQILFIHQTALVVPL